VPQYTLQLFQPQKFFSKNGERNFVYHIFECIDKKNKQRYFSVLDEKFIEKLQ